MGDPRKMEVENSPNPDIASVNAKLIELDSYRKRVAGAL
jgi:hypothetical protein